MSRPSLDHLPMHPVSLDGRQAGLDTLEIRALACLVDYDVGMIERAGKTVIDQPNVHAE